MAQVVVRQQQLGFPRDAVALARRRDGARAGSHKRLIDITAPSQKTVDALQRLEMPAGVYIDVKMKTK